MQEYDRSSKWLIEHYGKAMLRLAGVENVGSCKALQAEVVQPRQLPDGLLEVHFTDRAERGLFLLEIATYPDRRVVEQAIRNALLVYLDRRKLPEVICLVLHPKGHLQVTGIETMESPLQWTSIQITWRVVKLWQLVARDLLAANEIGLIPWVPLAGGTEPPEVVLRECRERIDRQASENEKANLLAVTQVLARLRYNAPELLAIFGGNQAMIESPLIQEITERTEARAKRDDITRFLAARFKAVPDDISARLRAITDLDRLNALIDLVAQCSNLEDFRAGLE